MEDIIHSELARLGLAGLMILGLVWDRLQLKKELTDVRAELKSEHEQARTDLQDGHKEDLEMTERLLSALTAGARATETQAVATRELKETLETLTDPRAIRVRR